MRQFRAALHRSDERDTHLKSTGRSHSDAKELGQALVCSSCPSCRIGIPSCRQRRESMRCWTCRARTKKLGTRQSDGSETWGPAFKTPCACNRCGCNWNLSASTCAGWRLVWIGADALTGNCTSQPQRSFGAPQQKQQSCWSSTKCQKASVFNWTLYEGSKPPARKPARNWIQA